MATRTSTLTDLESIAVRTFWKNYRLGGFSRNMYNSAKEKAPQSETCFQAILDTITTPCLFFDSEANLTECNKQAYTFFGFNSKEDLLENFFRLSPKFQNGKLNSEKVKEAVRNSFITGKNTINLEYVKKDGSPIPVEMSLSRILWNNNYRVVSYVRDMGKLKELHASINTILGTADTLKKTTEKDKLDDYYATLTEGGKYLLTLVNDIFDMAV